MSTEVAEKQDLYREDFQRLTDRQGDGFAWLRPVRDQAMQRFGELGFPTMKDEEWRFTNVKPIARTPFTLPEPGAAEVDAKAIEPYRFADASGAQLVFVDGHYREDLSNLGDLPKGVTVRSLAEAIAEDGELLHDHLAQYARYHDDAFTALNTAFIDDGALVHVDRNAVIERPIHLLYVSTTPDREQVTHPRNLIVAGESSEATVIEQYVGLGDGVYFSNTVTEAVVGANAKLRHYLVERESEQAYNIGTLRVHQERDSDFESHTALYGGAIVRNNVHVELHGTGCESLANGLFMPRDKQHMDNHMRVAHMQPHCHSRQFYRGVLNDQARGVFGGRIYVERDAQKTDAEQNNRNLLLTDEAQINTKPQLEIYADDVRCTHGATTGELEREALFYLKSRGLSEEAARGLLVYAFAKESLDRMSLDPVRDEMETLLVQRLPQPDALQMLF